ncbi:hypothetical protein CIHG_04578 [Coccidioides immitis H538.4]|uniref:Major facilitator superfamily (MFS) profile domain-containing protein n=1 Tax=Coccidioides immitis H538.4 TaxID=396776 RepID=A0A0J8RS71_COCIT|nr:hypothetical protein CIHG_04578 [Coccidioides immitis H538.4]
MTQADGEITPASSLSGIQLQLFMLDIPLYSAISFGLSKSMVAITLSRALGGLTNPNVGVVQTCVGELVERKEQQVSSDIITPIFLAIPAKPTKPADNLVERNIFQFTDVFGFSSQKIGFILLTQAGVAIIAQSTLIPWIVGRFGALKCYRMILCIFPVAYLFTPFLVKLKSPFSIIALLFDLWVKDTYVLLSSRINGVAASFGCLARSIGPLISGRLFKWGIQEGYIGIAFWTLSTVAFIGALESFFLLDHA